MSPLKDRTNPNGCPVGATWFAQVDYSDPYLVTQWYANGYEIADHSVTHSPPFAGSYAELEGMRAWANQYGGIPLGKIRGVRFPFRNYTVDSIDMISKMGFEYDSSMAGITSDRFWPYTLDYGSNSDCLSLTNVCGKELRAPGLWEIPMYGISSKLILI